MCISPPKTPATQTSTPTQTTATNLSLGTNQLENSQANIIGRLALTAPKAPPNGSPGAGTNTATPAGTLGLAPGANNATGRTTGFTPFNTGYNR